MKLGNSTGLVYSVCRLLDLYTNREQEGKNQGKEQIVLCRVFLNRHACYFCYQ